MSDVLSEDMLDARLAEARDHDAAPIFDDLWKVLNEWVAHDRALRAQLAEKDAEIGRVLFDHFPMLECDHEAKQDRVICGCSLVNLGWHPNVGEARRSWIAHIAALAAPDPGGAE